MMGWLFDRNYSLLTIWAVIWAAQISIRFNWWAGVLAFMAAFCLDDVCDWLANRWGEHD